MKAEKDKKTGKWLIQYRYTDWQGKRRKSTKRGFATKREAEEWLRNFLITQKADFDMKFEDFWKMYCADMETRLREHTMRTKKYIVELKILPYFGNKRVNDITAADIRQWQNELIKMGYSSTYLKTINNQLSAIFNYAVRYYDLKSNPCAKAGSMGKSKAEEMDFWTGEEFRKFIDSVMSKRLSYMAFMTLYWTGMRMGDADGKISLNQQKPSKHAGLRRFGPEKFLQRNNEFMKERPIFYKKPIKTEKDFSTWLRCFYYTTKAVITEYIYF